MLVRWARKSARLARQIALELAQSSLPLLVSPLPVQVLEALFIPHVPWHLLRHPFAIRFLGLVRRGEAIAWVAID